MGGWIREVKTGGTLRVGREREEHIALIGGKEGSGEKWILRSISFQRRLHQMNKSTIIYSLARKGRRNGVRRQNTALLLAVDVHPCTLECPYFLWCMRRSKLLEGRQARPGRHQFRLLKQSMIR